jgi:hypothetical protein
MIFKVAIDVEVQRVQGKFASRDDIQGAIQEELEQTEPDLSSLGADGDSEYEIVNWDVTVS